MHATPALGRVEEKRRLADRQFAVAGTPASLGDFLGCKRGASNEGDRMTREGCVTKWAAKRVATFFMYSAL